MPEPVSERTPVFRNIHLSNITGYDIKATGYIDGIEEMPVSEISFSDINMKAEEGFKMNLASDIEFHDVTISTDEGPSLIVTKSRNILMDNIKASFINNENPVIEISDSDKIVIYNCYTTSSEQSYVHSENSNVTVDCKPIADD